ncbi:MAG: DUF4407 domain-containing protein [Chitinophagaceae bacterium]|jgi:hypothetical protein|nr:DUF4407 domain-containing protein [Chitinophagaceae bacterium]
MMHASAPVGSAFSRRTDAFLWWLATAEAGLIRSCVVDRNRYRIVGATVFCTWWFATLAWIYFFSTVTASPWLYLPMGLFMGVVVLSIDRALIKGLGRGNGHRAGPWLVRTLLACTIGLFMAQPAVLFLFDREIRMQVSLDNEQRRRAKRLQLDSLYAGQQAELLRQQGKLEQDLTASYQELLSLQRQYLAETDGSGGSGKAGISVIAQAKKLELERLQAQYDQLSRHHQPLADSLQRRLQQLEETKRVEEARFAGLLQDGFLARVEAMQHLLDASPALAFRYYLIVAILMLIELMPLVAKSLLPAGPYEEQVRRVEETELLLAAKAAAHRRQLEELLLEQGAQADHQAMAEFFEAMATARPPVAEALQREWANIDSQSFRTLLERWRHRILSAGS